MRGIINIDRNARKLLILVAIFIVAYFCIRNLRFTHPLLNFFFVIGWLLLPFAAIKPVLKLSGKSKIAGLVVLAPILSLALLLLAFQVACTNLRRHDELVRDLGKASFKHSSIHLVSDATGGALGPHGLSLEQHLPILPGIYAIKYLDWYNGAYRGRLTIQGENRVWVQIPKDGTEGQPVNETYPIKTWMYF